VFIGDPFDPEFHWRGSRHGKAEPRPVSDLPSSERLWQALGRCFEKGQLAGRRTANAGWIGLATRRELLSLVDEASREPGEPFAPALREAVTGLDDRTIYYVVARPDDDGAPLGDASP
jgi:hypothetical protein